MTTYGEYETTRELAQGALVGVYAARHEHGADDAFLVKTCRPPSLLGRAEANRLIDAFLDSAGVQERVARACPQHWVAVHASGPAEDGVFAVYDRLPTDLSRLITGRVQADDAMLVSLVRDIAAGLEALEAEEGRPHGNIKPSNILVASGTPPRYLLADPRPGRDMGATSMRDDLRALGNALHSVIVGREGEASLPIVDGVPWKRLRHGAAFRDLCSRLLAPEGEPGIETVQQLREELAGLERSGGSGRRVIGFAAAAVVVIAGGVTAWALTRPSGTEVVVPVACDFPADEALRVLGSLRSQGSQDAWLWTLAADERFASASTRSQVAGSIAALAEGGALAEALEELAAEPRLFASGWGRTAGLNHAFFTDPWARFDQLVEQLTNPEICAYLTGLDRRVTEVVEAAKAVRSGMQAQASRLRQLGAATLADEIEARCSNFTQSVEAFRNDPEGSEPTSVAIEGISLDAILDAAGWVVSNDPERIASRIEEVRGVIDRIAQALPPAADSGAELDPFVAVILTTYDEELALARDLDRVETLTERATGATSAMLEVADRPDFDIKEMRAHAPIYRVEPGIESVIEWASSARRYVTIASEDPRTSTEWTARVAEARSELERFESEEPRGSRQSPVDDAAMLAEARGALTMLEEELGAWRQARRFEHERGALAEEAEAFLAQLRGVDDVLGAVARGRRENVAEVRVALEALGQRESFGPALSPRFRELVRASVAALPAGDDDAVYDLEAQVETLRAALSRLESLRLDEALLASARDSTRFAALGEWRTRRRSAALQEIAASVELPLADADIDWSAAPAWEAFGRDAAEVVRIVEDADRLDAALRDAAGDFDAATSLVEWPVADAWRRLDIDGTVAGMVATGWQRLARIRELAALDRAGVEDALRSRNASDWGMGAESTALLHRTLELPASGDAELVEGEATLFRQVERHRGAVGDATSDPLADARLRRWEQHVRAADTEALRAFVGLASRFAPIDRMPADIVFDMRRAELENVLANAGLDDDGRLAAIEQFLQGIPAAGDPRTDPSIEALRLLLDPSRERGIDLRSVGPGAAGWTLVSPEDQPQRVEYADPERDTVLAFKLVGPEEAASYVGVDEVSIGTFASILERCDSGTRSRLASIADEPVRAWRLAGGVPAPTRQWVGNSALLQRVNLVPDAYYPVGLAVGAPTARSPMMRVPPAVALQVAAAIGCRVPTEAEWRMAGSAARDSAPNLLGRELQPLYQHFEAQGQSRFWPKPTQEIFAPPGVVVSIYAQPSMHAANDGTLWFRDTDEQAPDIRNLTGNAFELVLKSDDVAEQLRQASSLVGIDAILARSPSPVGVIGGSALSPEGDVALDEFLPLAEVPYLQLTQGAEDVGFRMAFSVGGPLTVTLASEVTRVLEDLPRLARD